MTRGRRPNPRRAEISTRGRRSHPRAETAPPPRHAADGRGSQSADVGCLKNSPQGTGLNPAGSPKASRLSGISAENLRALPLSDARGVRGPEPCAAVTKSSSSMPPGTGTGSPRHSAPQPKVAKRRAKAQRKQTKRQCSGAPARVLECAARSHVQGTGGRLRNRPVLCPVGIDPKPQTM